MNVGTQVWFTAPQNVNQYDHGLEPGQVVPATVIEVGIQDDDWYQVSYDHDQRDIAAHIDDLTVREV